MGRPSIDSIKKDISRMCGISLEYLDGQLLNEFSNTTFEGYSSIESQYKFFTNIKDRLQVINNSVHMLSEKPWPFWAFIIFIGNPDLYMAFIKGEGSALKYQVEHGRTELYFAVLSGSETMTSCFVDYQYTGPTTQQCKDNAFLLSVQTVQNNDLYIAELLLESGANVDATDNSGNTALHLVDISKLYPHKRSIIKLLLKHGAKIIENIDGYTPFANTKQGDKDDALFFSMKKNDSSIVPLLLRSGANIKAKDKYGYTPSHYAATQQNWRVLLKSEIDVNFNVENEHDDTAHHCSMLLDGDYRVDINTKDAASYTPLHYAVLNGWFLVAERLLKLGADVNSETKDGDTAFRLAIWERQLVIAMLLAKSVVDINYEDSIGNAMLHYTAANGYLFLVKHLLELGADANLKIKGKHDMLLLCCGHSSYTWEEGCAPLHYAASQGRTSLVDLLLKHEADVNSETKDGDTALHLAVKNNQLLTAKRLLESGADISAINETGHTPRYYAPAEQDWRHLFTEADANFQSESNANLSGSHKLGNGQKVVVEKKRELPKMGDSAQQLGQSPDKSMSCNQPYDTDELPSAKRRKKPDKQPENNNSDFELFQHDVMTGSNDAKVEEMLPLSGETDEHAQISRLQQAIAKRYSKKYPGKYQQAKKFAAWVCSLINRVTPLTIILTTYNVNDGIGDYKHLVDAYLLMKDLLGHIPGICIKAIAFVGTCKLSIAELVTGDDIKDRYVYQSGAFDEERARQSDFIVMTHDKKEQLASVIDKSPYLSEILRNADMLLNVSTPFECNDILINHVNPARCFIYSWLEYGIVSTYTPITRNSLIYTQENGGLRKSSLGIKVDASLYNKSNRTNIKPEVILNELRDKAFLRQLLVNYDYHTNPIGAAQRYLDETSIVAGYLQNAWTIKLVIITAIALNENKFLDIFINLNYFLDDPVALGSLRTTLFKHGCSIHSCSHESTEHSMILIWKNGKRFIRLIDFRFHNDDIQRLLLLAKPNLILASGDNTIGACMSVGGLPFIAFRDFKAGFAREITDFCGKRFPILKQHFTYLRQLREYGGLSLAQQAKMFLDFVANIKDNRKQLAEEIDAFRSKIVTDRNAHDHFVELVEGFILTRLIKDGFNKDVLNYVRYREKITDEHNLNLIGKLQTLFFTAIKHGNLALCRILIEEGHDVNSPFYTTRLHAGQDSQNVKLDSYVYCRAYAKNVAAFFKQQHIVDWLSNLPAYKHNDEFGRTWWVCKTKPHNMHDGDHSITTLISQDQIPILEFLFDLFHSFSGDDFDFWYWVDVLRSNDPDVLLRALKLAFEANLHHDELNNTLLCSHFPPLCLAAKKDFLPIVQCLCNIDKVNVNQCIEVGDYKGANALYLAAEANHINMVRLLLEKGCDHNNTTAEGDTVIKQLIRHNQIALAIGLMQRNIDENIDTLANKTIIDLLKTIHANPEINKQIYDKLGKFSKLFTVKQNFRRVYLTCENEGICCKILRECSNITYDAQYGFGGDEKTLTNEHSDCHIHISRYCTIENLQKIVEVVTEINQEIQKTNKPWKLAKKTFTQHKLSSVLAITLITSGDDGHITGMLLQFSNEGVCKYIHNYYGISNKYSHWRNNSVYNIDNLSIKILDTKIKIINQIAGQIKIITAVMEKIDKLGNLCNMTYDFAGNVHLKYNNARLYKYIIDTCTVSDRLQHLFNMGHSSEWLKKIVVPRGDAMSEILNIVVKHTLNTVEQLKEPEHTEVQILSNRYSPFLAIKGKFILDDRHFRK